MSPSALSVTPTGTATIVCGSGSPASNNINGGSTQNFNFTCSNAAGDGTLVFGGSASGTDDNTGLAASTGNGSSNLITVDSTAPNVSITEASGTYTTPFSFHWSVTDPTVGGVSSGATGCSVVVDASTVSTACSGSQSLGAGTHSVTVSGSDIAGNAATPVSRSYTVTADSTPPTTAIALTPGVPNGSAGWYTVDVHVTVSATDNAGGTGVAETRCVLDPAIAPATFDDIPAGCAYSGAGNDVTTDGQHVVYAASKDNAGNKELPKSQSFKLDKTPPQQTACDSADGAWHAGNVTLHCTYTDATSGPASQQVALTTNVAPDNETSNASASANVAQACDAAGNCAASPADIPGNKIDRKAPQQSSCQSPDGVWHGSDVTLQCTYTDGGSGPASQQVPLTTNVPAGTETINAVASANGAQACDAVGNCAASPSDIPGNKVDKKPPQLSSCDVPDGNWHSTDVTLHCHYTDGGSGAGNLDVSLSTSVAAGTETANALASASGVQSCDAVGNCAASPADIGGNKVDKKAPLASCGTADGLWHAADVSIACTASDSGSGLANSGDASFSLTTSVPANTEDGNASTGTRHICDTVGNCSDAGPVAGNKVDKKAPTVSCGSADGVWHNADVSIACTASDGGSGLATSGDASFSLTTNVPANTEDSNASTNDHQVCDAVGNCSTGGPVTGNKVDKKPPQLSSCDAPDGAWHASDVTLHCHYTDGGSGAGNLDVSLSTSVAAGTETANAAASAGGAKACDAVNNCATSPADILGNKIDKKAPTGISGAPNRPADHNGWYNHAVGIVFSGTDGGSGIASCTNTTYSGPDGNPLTVPGTCTDAVGNVSGSVDSSSFKYDATKPTLSPYVSPTPVVLNGSATAYPNASDNLSGIESSSCDPLSLNSVGSKSVNCTATDNAGNTNTASAAYSVVYASTGLCLGSPGHQILQPINADGSSVFKQGSTVPAKFRVCDANGNSVGTPGVVYSFKLVQIVSGTVVNTVDEAVDSTTPDSYFRWDPTGMQWIFNISTKNSPFQKNTTYVFAITLNDSPTDVIYFQFGLK